MTLDTIATFRSPFPTKFGVPRQSGLVGDLPGQIVFTPRYRNADALRGLEAYDHMWLIWGFSGGFANAAGKHGQGDADVRWSPTVRPPVLGGNTRLGVWATRSPNRPNPLGLSSVRLSRIEFSTPDGPIVHVLGADLMDGTPIYDIKPYITFSDAHPGSRCGFAHDHAGDRLPVHFPTSASLDGLDLDLLADILSRDPRPRFHDCPDRVYAMPFMGREIRFRVSDGAVTVLA